MKAATDPMRILRMLFWETTIRCNLACVHCRRIESNEAAGADLTTAEAQSLIEQLAELGRRQGQPPVLVFSGGEPLCRAELFDLMASARQQGIIVALATNGTLIDSDKAQQIHDSGIARVSVSLDGADAATHDQMRQIPGAFERAIEGVRHLRECGVAFQINATLTRQNARQLGQVYELAQSLGSVALHIFMLVPVGCGQVLAATDMLSPSEYEQTLRRIHTLEGQGPMQIRVTCGPHYERVKRQMRNEYPVANPQSKGCLAGLGVLFVNHRGDVYPCGYLPLYCGNILQTTLAQIWDENKDLARVRDTEALEGKCGRCGYKRICGGCRARAFGTSGDYMAEEPFCAYIPSNARGTGG